MRASTGRVDDFEEEGEEDSFEGGEGEKDSCSFEFEGEEEKEEKEEQEEEEEEADPTAPRALGSMRIHRKRHRSGRGGAPTMISDGVRLMVGGMCEDLIPHRRQSKTAKRIAN